MASKSKHHKNGATRGRRNSPDFRGFINVNPRSQDKATIKQIVEQSTSELLLEQLCQSEGLKVGIKWLDAENAYNATLYDGDFSSPNAGLMLSSMHVDPLTALAILSHYHVTLCDGGDWEEHSPDKDVDW